MGRSTKVLGNIKLPPPLNFTFKWEDDGDDGDDDDDDDEMRETIRHPFAQTDDMGNLTKHWPYAVKTHFPGQHIRPGRIFSILQFWHVREPLPPCCDSP